MFLGVLLDTGFLYALRKKKETNHALAAKALKEFDWKSEGPAITSDLVVNETYTLMNKRSSGNPAALESLDQLFWGDDLFFLIITQFREDYRNIAEVLKKYTTPKRVLSFVDASLIYLANKFNYSIIFTFDSHFDGILKTHSFWR